MLRATLTLFALKRNLTNLYLNTNVRSWVLKVEIDLEINLFFVYDNIQAKMCSHDWHCTYSFIVCQYHTRLYYNWINVEYSARHCLHKILSVELYFERNFFFINCVVNQLIGWKLQLHVSGRWFIFLFTIYDWETV
jgi:hypothetical protein